MSHADLFDTDTPCFSFHMVASRLPLEVVLQQHRSHDAGEAGWHNSRSSMCKVTRGSGVQGSNETGEHLTWLNLTEEISACCL